MNPYPVLMSKLIQYNYIQLQVKALERLEVLLENEEVQETIFPVIPHLLEPKDNDVMDLLALPSRSQLSLNTIDDKDAILRSDKSKNVFSFDTTTRSLFNSSADYMFVQRESGEEFSRSVGFFNRDNDIKASNSKISLPNYYKTPNSLLANSYQSASTSNLILDLHLCLTK